MAFDDHNYPRRRGLCETTHCGGFISVSLRDHSKFLPIKKRPKGIRTWEHTTLCVCGAPWLSHALLPDGPVSANRAPSQSAVIQPPPQPPTPQPPDTGSRVPAMDRFGGVPQPVRGNAGTRRAASAARSLPHGPFAAAFANHFGPRTPYPGATTTAQASNSGLDILVACWPNTLADSEYEPPGYPARPIVIRNEHLKKYADRLDKFHLISKIQKLAAHHLYALCPADAFDESSSDDLHSQPFILLQSSLRLDVEWQASNPMKGSNANIPWIWLPGMVSPWPYRFLFDVRCPTIRQTPMLRPPCSRSTPDAHRAGRNDPLDLDCYVQYCPEPEITPILSSLLGSDAAALPPPPRPTTPPLRPITPSQQPLLIRQRSPQSQGASDDRRTDPPLNAPLPPQPPPRPPLTPLVVGVDVLEITDIIRWREFVATQVQPLARDASHVHIHGKTVEAVGACIVDLLTYFQRRSDRDEPFHMEDRRLQTRQIVRCNASDMAVESFLRDCRLISLGVRLGSSTRAITQGVGPERAALRHGCTVLTQRHHYWQQVPSSRMFRPVFLPGAMALPERIKTFHAHGIFLALHCFLLQHGPQPISIWLLLALIKGRRRCLFPSIFFCIWIPGHTISWLRGTTSIKTQPFPTCRGESPVARPNLINNHRTKEEHEGWIISAFATILLGHPAPWDVPEFIALRDAFNTALGTLRFSDTLRGLDASAFLVTIYDRRVTAVDQVADHLRFQVVSRASDLTTPYFVKLFKLRLHHYLRGVGHPSELRERLQAFGVSEQELLLVATIHSYVPT
ncbi:hypothetical protein B0H10DRAFT_2240199 [Mycena sp. CBHHK59/15]|nr:hypothetical protein B0H10DRAFT_2240199 [Mycena sp. CBHHK59/15]